MSIYKDTNKNIGYIRTFKTGSTTITGTFFSGDDTVLIMHPSETDYAETKLFSTVRNPYDRIESLLNMFLWYADQELTVKKVIDRLKSDVKVHTPEDTGWIKLHALPFTDPYFSINRAHRIFKLEDFDTQWGEICDFCGCDRVDMPKLNAGEHKVKLTQQDKDMVYEYYKTDFEVFGYGK